ncbi:MAG: hypothetical protein KBS76_02660 [Ruminococcus sp.]|nr:hypothetical protein [Candidatus Apopatosoma intestinale]
MKKLWRTAEDKWDDAVGMIRRADIPLHCHRKSALRFGDSRISMGADCNGTLSGMDLAIALVAMILLIAMIGELACLCGGMTMRKKKR